MMVTIGKLLVWYREHSIRSDNNIIMPKKSHNIACYFVYIATHLIIVRKLAYRNEPAIFSNQHTVFLFVFNPLYQYNNHSKSLAGIV